MKNKYYFLTHLNNVGYSTTGEISHLITPLRFNELASVGDGRRAARWITLRAAPLSFKQSRTHFNNDKLLSLNAIFNPLKKLKIHTLVFSNWDENQYVRKRRDNTEVHDTHFTNTEDYMLSKSKTALFGKAVVTYRPAKSQEIAAITKYYLAHRPNSGNVVFNGNPTKETLYDHNRRIDQKITYTNNIKEKTTLLITGRYIDERVSQDYRVNNYFFQGLFSDTNTVNNVRQSVDNSMHLAGVEAHWFRRGRRGHLLELRLGNLWHRDGLKSRFQLLEQQNPVGEPTGFQNNFIYQTNDTYFDSQYRYTINGLSLIGRVALHQLFNRINSSNAGLTEVTFPGSLTHIGTETFAECKLTTVILPNTLTHIGAWVFHGNQLAAVTIPNSLTAIEDLTFTNNQLTAISIPNSVTSIGKNAFAVNKLASVTIPNSVTFIDRNAFEANKLTTVTLSNSLTTIESGTFLLNQLTAVIIPNGVTDIKYAAFQENKLTAVTLPNSLTTIEGRAFLSNKLTDVTIPNSVTAIGDGSFFGNPDLVTVTLAKKLYDSFSSDELIFRFGDRVRTYKTHDGEILKEVVEDNAAP